jgi:UTP--glucose-1-phosphate uridylyltransferase
VGEKSQSIKAVIPAAGFGTRLQPFTLATPKELLPVNRKPMIQLAVEEALSAGIRDIGIVIRHGKEIIRNHFESLLTSTGSQWEELKRELSLAKVHFIYQDKPLGLGNAIYEAGEFIGDSPFIMIIPDQFLHSVISATSQLLHVARGDFQAVWSSLVTVLPEEKTLFPGARSFELSKQAGNTWEVKGLLEHPVCDEEKTLLGFGRTYFPGELIEFFSEKFLNPATGEVDLLLSFRALIKKYRNYAVLLEGMAMDFGTWAGYQRFSQPQPN